MTTENENLSRFDVVIVGAGLAGLTLARHLLLTSEKRILLIEKRDHVPPQRQKVGESTVQVGAYYFSKVLDLEEHLFRKQLMKYNLRFYWKTLGRSNLALEDYGQAYIRTFSNICCYQLDRNVFEAELLRLNCENCRFTFHQSTRHLAIELSDFGLHVASYEQNGRRHKVEAEWVVDASGRGKVLARNKGLLQENEIHHGAAYMWIDGLLDIERLTVLSPHQLRTKQERRSIGHSPLWLATNHFMGEGYWFWVIPLQGKTSLGLVFDNRLIAPEQVWTPERLTNWVCNEIPLFRSKLPVKKIIDYGFHRNFSYGCEQTISPCRWALTGEAGRFTDPLYSPGSDLIALHNTLIVDAILSSNGELPAKAAAYEQLERALYRATVPTYAVTYDALGDQECFVLKYVWELSVYFGFYVFPFINNLFTNREFVRLFFLRFSRLGAINLNLQQFLSAYYQWKKKTGERPPRVPVFFDFTEIETLRLAERTFYEIVDSPEEGDRILRQQLDNLEALARYLVAHVYSIVLQDQRLLADAAFVASINVRKLSFDPTLKVNVDTPNAGETCRIPFLPDIFKCFHTRNTEIETKGKPAVDIHSAEARISADLNTVGCD